MKTKPLAISYFAFAILFISSLRGVSQTLVINEVMSSNDTVLQDKFGDYPDWIELYNSSNELVNLHQYSLSDDEDDLQKWRFPEVSIEPKSFLVLFASGRDTLIDNEFHTNFKIKQTGEPLFLASHQVEVLSSVAPVFIPTNTSYACVVDGNKQMTITNTPTPGASNSQSNGIYCSHPSGFYSEAFDLSLVSSSPNQLIRYTLNGETPSAQSNLYSSTLLIDAQEEHELSISQIPTTPLSKPANAYNIKWKTPKRVYKGHVIRYAVFENDSLRSKIYTKTYFVDPSIKKRYIFPVLSLVTDSLNLFDYESGIYIPGKRFDEEGYNWFAIGNYNNRGKAWERAMHISYFEPDGTLAFETDAGMRMRGLGSLSNPQKSFNVYFRNAYGRSKVDYPIFEGSKATTFKRLIFRNGGQDFTYSHFKDAMLQTLIEPLNLDLQAYQPSLVFINGEYWGIHNIREMYDEHHFKYSFDIEEDSVNILGVCGSVDEGSNSDYLALTDYVSTHDLSQNEAYNYVASQIDIENMIDFQIAEIYFANYDWPCNNFKIWKDNSPESKWRFLIYDLDFSFGYDHRSSYNVNSIEHATKIANDWPHCACSNLLFRALLQNQNFKHQFLERFQYALNQTFEPQHVIDLIDRFEEQYRPEIEEHIDRWRYPSSLSKWNEALNKQRLFAQKRPCVMMEHLRSYFDEDTTGWTCPTLAEYQLNISVYPNPNTGLFQLVNNGATDIKYGNIRVFDGLGRLVFSEAQVQIEAFEQKEIQLNGLSSGVYFLSLKSNHLTKTVKITVI
ncbi:MAG: CotH kinase family protein [Flavobacteriales bacterium]